MELIDSFLLPAGSSPQLSLDALGERIVGMAGRLAAATSRWLVLVAEFDARQGYRRLGLTSTAQWLTHACGIAQRTAVEHVRVGRSLAQYPRLAAEMGAGRLSYSQVRAISRIAAPGAPAELAAPGEPAVPAAPGALGEPGLVDDLIVAARYGTVAQLEALVRGLRTIEDNDNEAPARPVEYVTRSWTSDSRWRLGARLDPERGAVVDAAIEAITRAGGISAADALVRLAEIGLAALADGENPPRGLRDDERAAVVIHLDEARIPVPAAHQRGGDETTAGDTAAGGTAAAEALVPRSAERGRPYGRIAGGPGLPDRVIQRLVCAGRVRTVIHDRANNPLDVGRSRRLVTDRQYRALMVRQHGHCAHPGCPNTKNLHAHHRIHWLHGGRTDLDNLLLLCERHHLAHHDGAFHIRSLGAGRFQFITRDGRDLSAPTRPAANPDTRPIEDDHPNIAPDAATTRWDGQRLDRPYAISVLAQHRQAAS